MIASRGRLIVTMTIVGALSGLGLAAPASGSTRAAAQGVTKDEIEVVVVVSDLTGLRRQGINLPAKLTTENLIKRWESGFAEMGKINGRTVKVTGVTWNPIDATTYEGACVKATQDNKPFYVLNSAGFLRGIPCVAIDNRTPFFYGESVDASQQAGAKKNLISLGVPAEASAKTAVNLIAQEKLFPKTAKIGILSANEPSLKSTGDTAETELKKNGYQVASKIEINTLQADASAINRESAAAVATMKAAGVDTVIINIPFTSNTGFFQEAKRSNAGFQYLLLDVAAGLCTQFGASRTPLEVAELGVPCVTTWDTRALPTKDGIKKDNKLEAECRSLFDKAFNETTQPGVPAGDLTLPDGTVLTEDLSANECTMLYLFEKGLRAAGKNPTPEKVWNGMMKVTSGPAVYMSDGQGGFAKDKPYYATKVHLEKLTAASSSTVKDARGLFNGCPAPVNCWVPQLVNGEEWFEVTNK